MSTDQLHLVHRGDATASFRSLARRLRDFRQPMTPEIREALAQIVESLEKVHLHQQALQEALGATDDPPVDMTSSHDAN